MQGEITVSRGAVVIDHGPDSQEWRFDLVAKHAEIQGIMGGDTYGVCLGANKRTMEVDESRKGKLTVIEFRLPKGWELLVADCSRYTCRVILARRRRGYRNRQWTEKEYPY